VSETATDVSANKCSSSAYSHIKTMLKLALNEHPLRSELPTLGSDVAQSCLLLQSWESMGIGDIQGDHSLSLYENKSWNILLQ